eukprot:PITA_01859
MNKATHKYHFPLPSIDQVLDTLARKQFFSLLDSFSGYNQIQISLEDQDKTTFTYPWVTFTYRVLPFGLCNAPSIFQRAILSIFSDLINEGLELYMDEFTPYGDDFDQELQKLEKEFDITIKDGPGKENPVAGFIFQIPKVNDPLSVDDQFPYEHLFAVTLKMSWYIDVENYLAVEKLPKHLTARERKQIVQCNARFFWIGGYLFHKGSEVCIRKCIKKDDIYDILKACHDKPCGGRFADRRIGHKVL